MHWFSLELKPEVARKMNRNQYRAARSWLRFVRRQMIEQGLMDKQLFDKNMAESAGV